MAAVYEGWEYPPPDCYSCDHRDSEGHLRYKGALLKKGGSRSAKIKTDRNSGDKTPKSSFFGRRNWSDRFFYLDLDKGHWSYYKDAGYENLAGVVRLLPHSSIVVPEEVRLRGRHAPTDPTETLNYFEVHHTTDDAGKVRTAPFVVRAPSPREFEDWLRALRWCLARLRRGSLSEEPSAGGVSRDFYLSGGSAAAGVTPETHTACARGVRGPSHVPRERAPSREKEAVGDGVEVEQARHRADATPNTHATHTGPPQQNRRRTTRTSSRRPWITSVSPVNQNESPKKKGPRRRS